jgi:hypothetical protein
VARGIAELALSPGSAGLAYHLCDAVSVSPRRMFELLGKAGLDTPGVPPQEWQQRVAQRALATGNEVLSTMALYELEGHALGEHDLEARAWRSWLAARDLAAAPTGELLRAGLTFLAGTPSAIGELLTDLTPDPEEAR